MSAPPAHKDRDSSNKSQSYASASKESLQERSDATQQHDDKDGKVKEAESHAADASPARAKEQHERMDGSDKKKASHAADPSHETKSTIVQEEKVPEPGFDAPEDKMQGKVQATFLLLAMLLDCSSVLSRRLFRCINSVLVSAALHQVSEPMTRG